MFDFSKIKDIPLFTTISAAFLTYLFGFRKGKLEKFNSQLEDNLINIISPMLHYIKNIQREDSPLRREKLLDKFFQEYSSKATKLFKIASKDLLDIYYKTEELFYLFLKERTENN